MKKNIILSFILSLFLSIPVTSFAQTLKTITLTDGTVINGTILQLNNSTYTIKTTNLGTISIDDANITEITNAQPNSQDNSSDNNKLNQEELKGHIADIQSTLLSNPAILEEIKKLMNDPEIVNLMSDPSFIQTIMSYDPEKIQNDSRAQELMQNPKIQKLMEKMQQTLNH